MKLIRISVENFGVLHDYTVDCHSGLNVFCRDNGTGKTTLAAFLSAMLYGLPASRKSDLSENERKKYQPWQGGPFGGSITFSVHDKTYRAERHFADGASARRDTFILYDLADNSVSNDYSDALGQELFGLDSAAFERSAYLPQKLLSGERANESITAKLNRAIGGETDSNEDAGLYQTAAAVLDRQRQYYTRHGGHGYIAELEQSLAALHEREYTALKARSDAEVYSAEADACSAEIAALNEKKQRLTEEQNAMQTMTAVLEHGRSLLEHRDAQLSAAAEKRQFLHLDDTEGITADRYGDAVISAAEESVRTCTRLQDRLDAVDSKMAQTEAELARISSLFCCGIPDADAQQTLSNAVRVLCEAPNEAQQCELPECFSDEELQRHTGQALMHAQMTEVLSQPKTALAEYRAVYAAAGIEEGDPLPDEDTLQAYADVLGAIAVNREKQEQLIPQKQNADAELQAMEAAHETIPAQKEIVVMRSRFDALRNRTEEIEELEARQRLAVQVDESIRRSRRVRIWVGIGLLLISAVLCVLYVLGRDIRCLIAGGVTVLPGLLLLVLGLLTRPEENDETRALEDAAQKRLCAKKSEFEAEKTAIYEFLDRIGGDASAVMDENEAAERFDAAAATAREREVLAERVQVLSGQLEMLTEEEARLCASLTSYTKSGGGEIADIGDDRAAFAAYRKKLQLCAAANRAYIEERETRAQAHARQDALSLALDRYLKDLSAQCPPDLQKHGDTENGTYTERMAAWCRTADMLRMQIGERNRVQAYRRETEQSLAEQLHALLACGVVLPMQEDDGAAAVLVRAQAVLALCERHRTLTDEASADVKQRAELCRQLEMHRNTQDEFLSGYFDMPLPTAEEGLQIIRNREAALAEDMNRLRDAQRQLNAFLSGHGMTEEALAEALQASADPDSTDSDQQTHVSASVRALEDALRQKTEQRAKALQNAEHASRAGADAPMLRAQIGQTEQTLSDARAALAVIRRTQACLDAARIALTTRYLAHMQERFRVYWARLMGIADDEAAGLSLDSSLSVMTEVLGARRDAAYFSRGTRDCIDFCVRLALIDTMYTDGGTKTDAPLPPILLDDPFVNLDRAHLAAARALLDEISDRFQILYFVCHDSRA